MRIIARKRLEGFAGEHAGARSSLERWYRLTRSAVWSSISDVRATFPGADPVAVASGNVATVFNIAGNEYRLITAIHYNRSIVYVLRFLTHADYSKDQWKAEL